MDSYSALYLDCCGSGFMCYVNLSNASKWTFKIVHFVVYKYATIELIENGILWQDSDYHGREGGASYIVSSSWCVCFAKIHWVDHLCDFSMYVMLH